MSDALPELGQLPLLPLRSAVLLPGVTMPIELGRPASVEAVRRATAAHLVGTALHQHVVVAVQRDPMNEQPELADLHGVACLTRVVQVLRGLPGRMTVIVRGVERVELDELVREGVEQVRWHRAAIVREPYTMLVALAEVLRDLVKRHEALVPSQRASRQRQDAVEEIQSEREPARVGDLVANLVELEQAQRIDILQQLDVAARLRRIIELVAHRCNELEVKRDVDRSVREYLSRHEHEAVLRHKVRAIQAELGDDDSDSWLEELAERLDQKILPEQAQLVVDRELARLERMNPQSSEAMIARTYLEWIADLPWVVPGRPRPRDAIDLEASRAKLEADHYGLEKIKRRILEYLAVRKLAPDQRGPLLCLAGPPGVGKTSLARSIAATLGRQFVRISLGGVRDDAEIRGHRRTYVGALPGRFIQAMKTAGTIDPVILLDEVDKLTHADLRGDPAAALLEALDPEQNEGFEDHYLGVPYDLSNVVFICTANEVGAIPPVLADRLEIIRLSGYTLEEKLAIARHHLLPRELRENGLAGASAGGEVVVEDAVLERLATEYTRESGVRNLQRKLAALLRDVAMRRAEGDATAGQLHAADVPGILGPPPFGDELMDRSAQVGVATGLGWTPVGGQLLFVEVSTVVGEGRLRLTGSLGEVMKESAQTALSMIKSRARHFGIDERRFEKLDVHIHLPSGGVPKDGPSAGVALVTALCSALTGLRVRHDLAMTGEVTLRGHVLAVGGVREKVLAAHRAGIREVVLPARNRKDEPELPERARADMTLHFVSDVDEVLALALVPDAKGAVA
jgi:ATP-dependent Lon protease